MKTYALFDVVGVKAALRSGDTGMVRKFWHCADLWVSEPGNVPELQVPDTTTYKRPQQFIVTFSDTALLWVEPEFNLSDTYECILIPFKKKLEGIVGKAYCIVSRGEEVVPIETDPASGARTMNDSIRPSYFPVAGSGDAWANLWAAVPQIEAAKQWHEQFSLYCVGNSSLPEHMPPSDKVPFENFSGTADFIFALQ